MLSLIIDETLFEFAFGCAIASVAFLVVDYAYFVAQGGKESLLNIKYLGNNFLFIVITWFLGAFVVGYFAVYVGMFHEESRLSVVTVGILWPIVLSKMIAGARGHLDAEEDIEEREP
uniref:Uncharacterized protein n=1 Tax=Candidatus Kentrum sp. MB TaxID=2138164 RepID=A0A450XF38_9GAMM|nr:MAG: hypothetical protein BECKMB1821G_GA0114241_103129 [Candidatus Kentron sp. MB]VFK31787.1 MAG: hypothetical protein BECKMB1821I_GA0114274_10276 [Candidatus Kentron sp. MB]VFK75563.1 MAG: hypothetical protein BECKMB1821H_GA0114242_10266 [Candidatus Kentron sp. MB]